MLRVPCVALCGLDLPKEVEHDVEREHVRLHAYWRMHGRCILSPVFVQMWQPSPGADVLREVGPIPVQMWPGHAQSRCGCGRGEPAQSQCRCGRSRTLCRTFCCGGQLLLRRGCTAVTQGYWSTDRPGARVTEYRTRQVLQAPRAMSHPYGPWHIVRPAALIGDHTDWHVARGSAVGRDARCVTHVLGL